MNQIKTQTPISTLFESYQLGDLVLPNKFVMASLTRIRADPTTGVPSELHAKYYAQRASAGLILTECSPIAKNANSFLGAGGIYTVEQVQGWKKVTRAVHAKGGRIFLQIWHGGRAAHPAQVGEPTFAPSAIAIRGNLRSNLPHAVPKEMTTDDIKLVIEQFRQGALNAKEAGFDGIELHGANGYLVDQFLRDGSNKRTDEYGGSVENRTRFALEVMDVLIGVFGAQRVGIKLSPVGRSQDMYDTDPVATFGHLLQQLEKRGIAYVQLREPEPANPRDSKFELGAKQIAEVCKTFRPYFKGTIVINQSQTPESVVKAIAEGFANLGCFGRPFISNPDFVERVLNGWPQNEWDSHTFYGPNEKGYTDYPFYEAKKEEASEN